MDSGKSSVENSEMYDHKQFLDICIEETHTDIPEVREGDEKVENSSRKRSTEKVNSCITSHSQT